MQSNLIKKAKDLGLNLAGYEVRDIDHDESFYMLTYRLPATFLHIDGAIQPINTNLEIACNGDRDLEITSNWFNAFIETIGGVERVVCDRPDGRIIFDLEVSPKA